MRIWLIATKPQDSVDPLHRQMTKRTINNASSQHHTLASVISFVVSGILVYAVTLMWLPSAQAAPDANIEPTNVQINQLLTHVGGPSLFQGAAFPEIMVVSDHAIQPDLGIFDVNDSGFLDDVPELNPIRPKEERNNMPFKHIVAPGETLLGIADRYGLRLTTLLAANDLSEKSTLRAGKELRILPIDGVEHKVVSGDTLSGIASKYEAKSSEIAEYNSIDPAKLKVGLTLIIPGGKPLLASSTNTINQRGSLSSGSKRVKAGQEIGGIWVPVDGEISQGPGPSSFAQASGIYKGDIHRGLDIANQTGTSVRAAHSGTVTLAKVLNGYGKVIYLKGKDLNGRTIFTRYGHLSSIDVKVGQTVEIGEHIGKMGSTGRSTGPHLHFEIRDASGDLMNSHPLFQMYWGY